MSALRATPRCWHARKISATAIAAVKAKRIHVLSAGLWAMVNTVPSAAANEKPASRPGRTRWPRAALTTPETIGTVAQSSSASLPSGICGDNRAKNMDSFAARLSTAREAAAMTAPRVAVTTGQTVAIAAEIATTDDSVAIAMNSVHPRLVT